MRRSVQWTLILGALLAMTFGVAACGGDDDDSRRAERDRRYSPPRARRAESYLSLWAGDTDNIDPGITYYPVGLPDHPGDPEDAVPPQDRRRSVVSRTLPRPTPTSPRTGCTSDGHDQEGREVLAAGRPRGHVEGRQVRDRARLLQQRQQRLRAAYFGGLKGAKVGAKPGTKIPGIETPDDSTIVFNLAPAEGADGAPAASSPSARRALYVTGAGGVRGGVRRRVPDDVRPAPGRDRSVHDRERRRGQGGRLRARAAASTSCATRTGTRHSTTARPTSTRSRSRRATTTRPSCRARSSTART